MSSGAMSSGKNGSSDLLPDGPAGDAAQDTLSESSDVDDGEECAADARQGEGSRRSSPQLAATIDVSDALTEDDTGGGQAAGDEELAARDDGTDETVEIQRKVKHCHVSDFSHSDSLHQTGSASQSEAGVRWQKPVPEASGGDYAVEVNGPPAANGSRVETYKGWFLVFLEMVDPCRAAKTGGATLSMLRDTQLRMVLSWPRRKGVRYMRGGGEYENAALAANLSHENNNLT